MICWVSGEKDIGRRGEYGGEKEREQETYKYPEC
jgi:hypothetical protein